MAAAAAALSLSFPESAFYLSKRLPWKRNQTLFLRRKQSREQRNLRFVTKPCGVRASTATPKEEDQFSILTSVKSDHNEIVVVDTPNSRILLLDSTHNVHSIYNKGQRWTGAYWDEFASLPAIVPEGPIAIMGLGGGTAAHLMLDLWPSLKLEGWEIDGILIDKAREFFGLSELEKCNQDGGILNVHVGDAFSPSAIVPGGFAGIVVDLFSDGQVLLQLHEATTWLEFNKRLMPHGRIMANCGGSHLERANIAYGTWVQNSTIKALCEAFPGNLSWKRMTEGEGENYLALTGPTPDLDAWSAAMPDPLSSKVRHWMPCQIA